jgi:hypothetical protein
MAKPIVITDDSVLNSYGFRVMSAGADMSLYLKNPVMLYDHIRSRGENDKDIILPIGKMKELTMDGGRWIATPDFDMDDEFAVKIASKYDKDIFNMASIGFEANEWSTEPEMMLPGQTGPTITKWTLKEVSITDIGANPNACKLTYKGKTITLSEGMNPDELQDFFNSNKPTITSMKKVIAALNGSKLVTLNEASTEELVAASVETLVSQLSTKDSVISQKDTEIASLKDAAKAALTSALKDKATGLVESALSAKKIVAAQKEKFVNLASASEEGFTMVKEMLDSLKGYESVIPGLKAEIELPEAHADKVKMYDERAKNGTLKSLSEDNVKALWMAKYGKEIKAETLKAIFAK